MFVASKAPDAATNAPPIRKRKLTYEELEANYNELKVSNDEKSAKISRMITKYKSALIKIAEYERKEKEEKREKSDMAASKRKKTKETNSKFETLYLAKENEVKLLNQQMEELKKKLKPPQNRKLNAWWALHVNPVPEYIEKAVSVNCIDCNHSFPIKRPSGKPRLAYAKKQFEKHPCNRWSDCIARPKEICDWIICHRKQV